MSDISFFWLTERVMIFSTVLEELSQLRYAGTRYWNFDFITVAYQAKSFIAIASKASDQAFVDNEAAMGAHKVCRIEVLFYP